jgi:hypothetical protein
MKTQKQHKSVHFILHSNSQKKTNMPSDNIYCQINMLQGEKRNKSQLQKLYLCKDFLQSTKLIKKNNLKIHTKKIKTSERVIPEQVNKWPMFAR